MPIFVWDPNVAARQLEDTLNVLCPPCEQVSLRVDSGKFGHLVVLPDGGAVVITDLGSPVEIAPGGLSLFQSKLGLFKPDVSVHIAASKWLLGNDVLVLMGTMQRSNLAPICNFCLVRWLACPPDPGGVSAVDALVDALALPADSVRVPYSASMPLRKDFVEDYDATGNRHTAVLLVRALQTRSG